MSDTSLTLTWHNSAKHRATPEADIRLIYAGSANISNVWKHAASDYESEGRRFESCRARLRNTAICRGLNFRTFGLGSAETCSDSLSRIFRRLSKLLILPRKPIRREGTKRAGASTTQPLRWSAFLLLGSA